VVTAVDTNVLIDVLRGDPKFGVPSREALKRCRSEGSLIACEVVWAELGAGVGPGDQLKRVLDAMAIEFAAMDLEASFEAGRAWRAYRQRGGRRTRIISDFLIGAHARRNAERLLTRDRGFYGEYFRGLAVLDPSRTAKADQGAAGPRVRTR
jgi:predicted nucleic acid-binding protein